MGCVQSKCSSWHTGPDNKKKRFSQRDTGESNALVQSDSFPAKDLGDAKPVVISEWEPERSPAAIVSQQMLDFAERLSRQIVDEGMQLLSELDARYRDIPYIECDDSSLG